LAPADFALGWRGFPSANTRVYLAHVLAIKAFYKIGSRIYIFFPLLNLLTPYIEKRRATDFGFTQTNVKFNIYSFINNKKDVKI
jgi:hypothetical protein